MPSAKEKKKQHFKNRFLILIIFQQL